MQQTPPPARSRTYVVGCDAKSDIRVFSGITYHLAVQGVQDGLLNGMVNSIPARDTCVGRVHPCGLMEAERRVWGTQRLQVYRRLSRYRLAA